MKRLIVYLFRKLGFHISRITPNTTPLPAVGFNSLYLSSIINPDLVIDVGVGYGTWQLYEAYPKATILLVEPLATEYSDAIDKIKNAYSCEVHEKALGEAVGEMQLSFDAEDLQKASLFERTTLTKNLGPETTKTVAVSTLDELLVDKKIADQKVVLKIDTEGGELAVLKGGQSSLQNIDYVIAEVSLAKRFEGSYEFEELIGFMSEKGFKVFSFLTMPFPNREPRQRFADILFQNQSKVG